MKHQKIHNSCLFWEVWIRIIWFIVWSFARILELQGLLCSGTNVALLPDLSLSLFYSSMSFSLFLFNFFFLELCSNKKKCKGDICTIHCFWYWSFKKKCLLYWQLHNQNNIMVCWWCSIWTYVWTRWMHSCWSGACWKQKYYISGVTLHKHLSIY